eukprot:432427-Rhodomonas_salina.3
MEWSREGERERDAVVERGKETEGWSGRGRERGRGMEWSREGERERDGVVEGWKEREGVPELPPIPDTALPPSQ